MSCRSSVDLMSLRLDGLLDGTALDELEHHLATCTHCRGDWSNLQEADTLLRLSARKPVAPSADFVMKVMSRVAVTPVVRPPLWNRVRTEGGRLTVPLQQSGRRVTMPLPRTAPLAYGAPAPGGLRGALAHLQTRWVQVYLGALGGAAALAVLLVTALTTMLVVGGAPAQGALNTVFPAGPLLTPVFTAVSTELTAAWHLLTTWVAQVDLTVVGVVALAVLGCAALWAYLVNAYLRREGGGRIQA